ncbi:MAG: RT0821/Lpp0805 family surface protein [Pseudomonadota bacterium]
MKQVFVGVAIAALLAGCTVESQPRPVAYQPYPPPPRPTVLGDTCGDLGWGKVLGGALGGAAGGAIASNVVRGSGSGIATAAGVIGGMLLAALPARMSTRSIASRARAAQQQALQPTTPIGQTVQWSDPRSGAAGSFTPTRESRDSSGYCRDYSQTIIIGGEQKQGVGRACQQPRGSWKTVS